MSSTAPQSTLSADPFRPPVSVSLNGVTRAYGLGLSRVVALDRVTVEIFDGEFVAVMGPSGSGKSTLLNVIGALDRPSEGRVSVEGRDIATLDAREAARYRRRSVGFIFQSFNLLPRLTVLENVALPLMFEGVSSGERKSRAARVLSDVGLAERLNARPATLSGGEKQRVAIARALVNDPPVLLADEPTGNLDSRSAASVLALILELNQARGQTVILITHDAQVASHASRTIQMRDGRVVTGDKDNVDAAH